MDLSGASRPESWPGRTPPGGRGRPESWPGRTPPGARDASEVLRRALAGEGDAVAGALATIVHRDGVARAYDVAWCLAAATVGADLPAGAWRLDFPDIERAAYETRWVARFLSAYANADPTTGSALFQSAQADGALRDCLLTLAGSAAATLRRRTPGETK